MARQQQKNTATPPGARPATFIAPPTGGVAQNVCFNTAPSALEKTKGLLAAGRLKVPGSVIVWNQTEGRRKGSRGWWATHGTLTVVYAIDGARGRSPADVVELALGTLREFAAQEAPERAASLRMPNNVMLDGKKLARAAAYRTDGADLLDIALNVRTDFSKAPAEVRDQAVNLLEETDATPVFQVYLRLTAALLSALST